MGSLNRREFLKVGGGAFAGAVILAGCGGAGGGGGGGGAFEPNRNVVMVIPFEPGGGSDILGRAMAAGLEEVRPDVNISAENRAGGSGAVGYSYLLEQQADPHFLLASETAGIALPITTDTPFEWTDFTPIAQIAEDATLLVVAEDNEFESLADILEAAESGRVTVAVSGTTGLDTIVTALMEEEEGVEFEQVVFQSGGEILAAILGGEVDIAMLNPGEVIGQLEAGDMRAIVAFAEERYEGDLLSDIPTSVEEGVDAVFTQYRGLFAPGGITDEERQYWADAMTEWTETENYNGYIEDNYLISTVRTGQEFEDFLTEYEQTLRDVLG